MALIDEMRAAGATEAEANGPVPVNMPAKKGRKAPPADETKRQRFERVVGGRATNAIRAIQIIGSIGGNKHSYEYSSADVDVIVAALTEEVKALAVRLRPNPRQLDMPFSFAKGN